MELLDDECHMESRFGLFEDSVRLCARLVQGLRLMHHRLRNYFGSTRWYFSVKRLKWNLGLVYLQIVLVLMQDRYMLCMEHTICVEINMDASDETPR